ncbi:unnamed protein product, partial [Ectocarpus fasciculatus]
QTFAGFAWTFATAVTTGLIQRSEGDFLAHCYFEKSMVWTTVGTQLMSFGVRVYRMWRILIKHDDNMWPAKCQVSLLSSIGLIPLLVAFVDPDIYFFDEKSNSCGTSPASKHVMMAMDTVGFAGICYLWFVCTRQLRCVRKQFNEYEPMKWTLACLTLLMISYPALIGVIFKNERAYARRVAIVYPVLTTYTLLWGSIGEPIKRKLAGDTEYLLSFTKGFSEMPSPAQLKASLAEQLSVEQLRVEFRKYIETKVAQELMDFYLDSLDREEIKEYFPRQAATMRIVEQYIRQGAPEQVNISGRCREEILSTDVTAYDIFDHARAEVLALMETNFQRDFVETEGFRSIANASELEQQEIRLLRTQGFLVGDASPTLNSPSPASSATPPRGCLLKSFKSFSLMAGRLLSSSS